jgi:hypothetical protein
MMTTSNDPCDAELLCQQFRVIVGSIVVFAEPLSISSLAELLNLPQDDIWSHLSSLHSVLHIPADFETPVRTLHLSFAEFLLSDKLQHQSFRVDGLGTHRMLLTRCLEVLSGSHGLQENLCELQHPGQLRQDIDLAIIDKRLSPAFQYACQYWIHHAEHSNVQIHDDDEVHVFLQKHFLHKHFLHWLEALSLMNRIAKAIGYIGILRSIASVSDLRRNILT